MSKTMKIEIVAGDSSFVCRLPIWANVLEGLAVHKSVNVEYFGTALQRVMWTGTYTVTHADAGVALWRSSTMAAAVDARRQLLSCFVGRVHPGQVPACELFALAPLFVEQLRSGRVSIYAGTIYTPAEVINRAAELAELLCEVPPQ